MPYIDPDIRTKLRPPIQRLLQEISLSGEREGCATYVVYVILLELYRREPRFKGIAAAVGVVQCALLEFYRRVAANHEDGAIERNGDVDSTDVWAVEWRSSKAAKKHDIT